MHPSRPQRGDETFHSQDGTFPEQEETLCGAAHQTNARTNTSTAVLTQHKDAFPLPNSFFYSVSPVVDLDRVACQIYGGQERPTELRKAGGWSLYYRHDGEIKVPWKAHAKPSETMQMCKCAGAAP